MSSDSYDSPSSDHYPIPHHYPGTYWEPEEVTLTCGCGATVYEWQAGAGGTAPDGWGEAFQEHLDAMDENETQENEE